MPELGLDDLKGGMSPEELNASLETPQEVQPTAEVEPTPEVIPPQETQPVEEAPRVEEPAAEVTPPAEELDFTFLNKTLNKEYKSIEELQADLNKPTKELELTELETKYANLQKMYDESSQVNELLTEQLDPANLFANEEDQKLAVFKKANPKKDPNIAQTVFATEDLSTIDDIELVKMGWKFNAAKKLKGTEKDLEAAIAEELGQDPDTPVSEWSVSAQNRLQMMAGSYVSQFEQLKSSIELPKKINIDELRSQRTLDTEAKLKSLQEGWDLTAEETLKETTSLKVPIGTPAEGEEPTFFEWDLGKAPQEEVEGLKAQYLKAGLDPKESKELFQKGLQLALIDANLPQIMQKYGDDIAARMKEEFLDKSHNPEPLKDTVRPEAGGAEKELEERSNWAIGSVGSQFHSHPLFRNET